MPATIVPPKRCQDSLKRVTVTIIVSKEFKAIHDDPLTDIQLCKTSLVWITLAVTLSTDLAVAQIQFQSGQNRSRCWVMFTRSRAS